MEMQGQSKKQTGKNRPFSPNTVFPAHATDGKDQRAAGGAVMMPGPIHTAEYEEWETAAVTRTAHLVSI